MRHLWPLAWLALGGCTLGFNYQQCEKKEDCAALEGQPFCTPDGFCVTDPPPTELCGRQYPDSPPSDKAIAVGALFDLTPGGRDEIRIRAMQLAIDEINDQARFNMNIRPLVAYVCDTGQARTGDLRSKDMESMIQFLSEQKRVYGIVGPTTDQDVKTVLPTVSARQVPIVSPASDGAELGDDKRKGFFFRTPPTATLQAQTLAQSAKDLPNNAPAPNAVYLTLASEQSAYGESLRQSFQAKWAERNQLNVPSATPTFPSALSEQQKVASVGANIVSADPQPGYVMIFVSRPAQPQVPILLEKLKDLKTFGAGMKPTNIWLNDGAIAPSLLPLALDPAYQKMLLSVRGIAPAALDRTTTGARPLTQSAAEFVANLQAQKMVTVAPETGTYDPAIGYTYDATYVLAAAVESVRGADSPGLPTAQALRRIKSGMAMRQFAVGPGSFGSFAVGVTNLQASGEVGMTGVTGAVRFTAEGDRETIAFERWSIDMVPGTPETPAAAKFTFNPF